MRARRKRLTSIADWSRTTKDSPSGLLDRYGTSRYDLSSGLGSGSGRCIQCPKSKREIWSWCYRCANRSLINYHIIGRDGRNVRGHCRMGRLEGNSRSQANEWHVRANGWYVRTNGWCGCKSGSTGEVIWGYSVGERYVSDFSHSIKISHQAWWTPNNVFSPKRVVG